MNRSPRAPDESIDNEKKRRSLPKTSRDDRVESSEKLGKISCSPPPSSYMSPTKASSSKDLPSIRSKTPDVAIARHYVSPSSTTIDRKPKKSSPVITSTSSVRPLHLTRSTNSEHSDTKDLMKRLQEESKKAKDAISEMEEYRAVTEREKKIDAGKIADLESLITDVNTKLTEANGHVSRVEAENINLNERMTKIERKLKDTLDGANAEIARLHGKTERLERAFEKEVERTVRERSGTLENQVATLTLQRDEKIKELSDLREIYRRAEVKHMEELKVRAVSQPPVDTNSNIKLPETLPPIQETGIIRTDASTLPSQVFPEKKENIPKQPIQDTKQIPMTPMPPVPIASAPIKKVKGSKKALVHPSLNCHKWYGLECTNENCSKDKTLKTREETESAFAYSLFGDTKTKLSKRSYRVTESPEDIKEAYRNKDKRKLAFAWAAYSTMLNTKMERHAANRYIPGREMEIISSTKIIEILEKFCNHYGIQAVSDHVSNIMFM